MNEHTTFEEKIVENEAQIPSFTLCPTQTIDILFVLDNRQQSVSILYQKRYKDQGFPH